MFKCFTWNLGYRLKKISSQMKAVLDRNPNIIAFQEVTLESSKIIKKILSSSYKNIVDGFELISDKSLLKGPRRLGVLIATNYDLKLRSQNEFDIPWPERILAADITILHETIEFYNTYIPPGSSNRWKKIETLEGLYKGLTKHTEKKRILCGDFNTPQDELLKYGVCTFAQKINKKGVPKLRKIFRGGSGNRWDQGERNVLEGLKEFNLVDAYRQLHPIPKKAYSFVIERKGRVVAKRRFDHFFLSKEFKIKSIEYLHQFRESGLSDHSPLELIVH